MRAIAVLEDDEALTLQALHARWPDSVTRGWIGDAIDAATQGLAIYRPDAHHELTFRYGNHDPGCRGARCPCARPRRDRGPLGGASARADEAIAL